MTRPLWKPRPLDSDRLAGVHEPLTLRLRRNGEIADQRGRLRGHFQRLASGEYAVELRVPAARFCVSYYADIKPRVLEKLAEL